MSRNYPNPFNPVIKIKYSIPGQEYVKKIFELHGREVAFLLKEQKTAGSYELEFNGEGFQAVYISTEYKQESLRM